MAGARKHGSHRYALDLPALAAGAASDTHSLMSYDAYADAPAGTVVTAYTFPYDLTSEEVWQADLVLGATLTGQATNFSDLAFQQARAGAVINDIRVRFNAAGVSLPALTPANMAVGSGVAVPNAGTGTLLVNAGTALPWTIQQGDVFLIARVSSGTGQASPGWTVTFYTRQKSA